MKLDESFDDKMQRTAHEAARKKFTPEFMNRIDKTVVFKTLRDEHLVEIIEIELGMIQQRIMFAIGGNQFMFNCTEKAKEALLAEGTDPKYGARHLKRALERNLVFPLANLVATQQIKMGDYIVVNYEGDVPKQGEKAAGKFTFHCEATNVLMPNVVGAMGAMGTAARQGVVPITKKQFP